MWRELRCVEASEAQARPTVLEHAGDQPRAGGAGWVVGGARRLGRRAGGKRRRAGQVGMRGCGGGDEEDVVVDVGDVHGRAVCLLTTNTHIG